MVPKKIVHYLNQFYGGIGGEERADHRPEIREGSIGPGILLQKELGEDYEILATIICGDNYFAEHMDEAIEVILDRIMQYEPDVLVAGPAFNAGRYGIACGAVGEAVSEEFEIPVITGMYTENPGAEIYNKHIYIMEVGNSAASMRDAILKMASAVKKVINYGALGWPEEDGYIPMGYRVNIFSEETGAVRAINMLMAKVNNKPYKTELPMPQFGRVPPAPAIKGLAKAKIALATTGGIVPMGNPDRIESANATKWRKYDISDVADLKEGEYITVHGGFDPVYALLDADRILPLDALRELEKEGAIGIVDNYYYVTVGNATSVASASQFGDEMALDMLKNKIEGVILTST
jgi:glycine reductase